MYTDKIEVTFDYAHRLLNYEGKCHNIHGHLAKVVVEVGSSQLVGAGFVIDFGDLKRCVKSYIDDNWDHTLLLCSQDPLAIKLIDDTKIYLFIDKDPTAENMAYILYGELQRLLSSFDLKVLNVTIYETVNAAASYIPDPVGRI